MSAHVVRRDRVKTIKVGKVEKVRKSSLIVSRPFFGDSGLSTAMKFKELADKTPQMDPDVVDTFVVIALTDEEAAKL